MNGKNLFFAYLSADVCTAVYTEKVWPKACALGLELVTFGEWISLNKPTKEKDSFLCPENIVNVTCL